MTSGREPRKSKFQVLHLVSLRTSEPLFLSLNCTEVVPSFAPNENPKTCKAQVVPQTARKELVGSTSVTSVSHVRRTELVRQGQAAAEGRSHRHCVLAPPYRVFSRWQRSMHHSEVAVAQHVHTLEDDPICPKGHRRQAKSPGPERSCGVPASVESLR